MNSSLPPPPQIHFSTEERIQFLEIDEKFTTIMYIGKSLNEFDVGISFL